MELQNFSLEKGYPWSSGLSRTGPWFFRGGCAKALKWFGPPMETTYSIIIPAYNEAQRIGASLEKVVAHIAAAGWQAEVLVVNDGSSDSTAGLVQKDRKSTRLNSSHIQKSRMPSSA